MSLVLIPRISEKSYGLAQRNNTYVFNVPLQANKNQIAEAVAEQYSVTVADVHVLISKGKVKQSVRRGGRPVKGRRSDKKKAYVTLVEGDSIKIFDEEQ
jgi:large subunit ribosomal protein L23